MLQPHCSISAQNRRKIGKSTAFTTERYLRGTMSLTTDAAGAGELPRKPAQKAQSLVCGCESSILVIRAWEFETRLGNGVLK
jgi:hypothetical protein